MDSNRVYVSQLVLIRGIGSDGGNKLLIWRSLFYLQEKFGMYTVSNFTLICLQTFQTQADSREFSLKQLNAK